MKKRIIWIIIFIIGIVLLASGLFITFGVGANNTSVVSDSNAKNDEVISTEETDTHVDLKTFSKLIFKKDISSRNVSEIKGEELIRLLFSLNGNGLTTNVTGAKLKETAHDYLGIDDVEFADITCSYYDKNDKNVLYSYNKDTDKYEENLKHGGHGLITDGINYYFIDGKETSDENYYIYSAGLIYYYNGCRSDICTIDTAMDIYLSYEDIVNKTNLVMNAINNSEFCKESEHGVGYECNLEKISKAVNNPKNVNFYYKKVNDKYVFVKYEIK